MDEPTPPSNTEPQKASDLTRKLQLRRGPQGGVVRVPTLRVLSGPDILCHLVLHPEVEHLIGRDETCAMRLIDASVSRIHAMLCHDRQGRTTIKDLGSTNGTRLNGKTIIHSELTEGDHLEIGAVPVRLENLRADELQHLSAIQARLQASKRDPLTGLLTRAWLEEELPRMIDNTERTALTVSCIFVDADHFKRVNDTWGHTVGDEVLVTIARVVLQQVREQDACVRFGGEELVCFLPGCDEQEAYEVAHRIRVAVAGHDWTRAGTGLHVTVSAGVAERLPGEPLRAWLDRADKAVYAAKHAGRNMVMRATTGQSSSG